MSNIINAIGYLIVTGAAVVLLLSLLGGEYEEGVRGLASGYRQGESIDSQSRDH